MHLIQKIKIRILFDIFPIIPEFEEDITLISASTPIVINNIPLISASNLTVF